MSDDLESIVLVLVVAVVFENEVTVVEEVLEPLLLCTRILVKVGEIGKYSISVSSVDRVSGFFCGFARARSVQLSASESLLAFLPCHRKSHL